ncbi:MAG: hypothetical protein GY805_28345 [Chloroflexi bacterium]|nr:hypothetical protein [Chloroflexota bacterium]
MAIRLPCWDRMEWIMAWQFSSDEQNGRYHKINNECQETAVCESAQNCVQQGVFKN